MLKTAAFRKLLAVCLVSGALACVLPRQAEAINVHYTLTSDYIMFDIDNKIIYCEGQAELLYGMLRFQADTIRVDVKTHVMVAEGNVMATTMAVSQMNAPVIQEETEADDVEEDSGPLTDSDETSERLERRIENRESGNRQGYEGDQLRFDLERVTGLLLQTKKTVRYVYMTGEALNEVSEAPMIGEGIGLYEEPYLTANAITAARIRVSPGDMYEAWSATTWIKGNKVITLPFWTNTGKKYTAGKWRLRNVKYSSNSDWQVGTSVRYKEARDFKGFFDVGYSADGNRRYVATVRQAFRLNTQTSGNLSMNNLFGGDRGYTMSLSRYGNGGRSSNMQLGYDRAGSFGFRVGGTAGFKKTRINAFVSTRQDHSAGLSLINALVDFGGNRKQLGKIGYQVDSHLKWDNNKYRDAEGNAFVAVSAFRSGIVLSKSAGMDWDTSLGAGKDTEGNSRTRLTGSVKYSVRPGRGNLISLRYGYSNNRNSGSTTARQYLTLVMSKSKSLRWNTGFSASYDMREGKIGFLSNSLDYVFSKKCRLWTDLTYNIDLARFSSKNFHLTYDIYGTKVNTNWFVESNDFSFDFITNFQ